METNNSFQFPAVDIKKLAEYFVAWSINFDPFSFRRIDEEISTSRLQLLLYQAQVWHLAYFNTKLFHNNFYAKRYTIALDGTLDISEISLNIKTIASNHEFLGDAKKMNIYFLSRLNVHWEQQAFLNDFLARFGYKSNAELEMLSKWDGLWEKYVDITHNETFNQIPTDEMRQVYQQFLERQKIKKSLKN